MLAAAAVALLSGCAVQHRPPAPLAPATSAAALTARSLNDAGLLRFLRANHALGAAAPQAWTLPMLADAALYFSPAMAEARAQLAAAEAGEITAGARANPTLSLEPGVPNPYLFGLNWAIPMALGGQRGWRMRQAAALTAASRLNLARAAWQTRAAVRAAFSQSWAVGTDARRLQIQQQTQAARVRLLGQQLQAGEIARPDYATARLALATLQQARLHDASAAASAKAALAAAVGVPAAALEGVPLAWTDWHTPPDPATIAEASLQRQALVNSLEVRQALANYQAAEAGLQLELARQYPGIELGPGYQYEEGRSYFTIGLSLTLPIFNHNQGPIAEAEARRQQAGAAVMAAQAKVMAASDAAWAAYRGAYAEWQAARAFTGQRNGQARLVNDARAAGETDALAVYDAQLQTAIASTDAAAALARVQAALGDLEAAVEQPLAGEQAPLLARKEAP